MRKTQSKGHILEPHYDLISVQNQQKAAVDKLHADYALHQSAVYGDM